MACNTWIAVVFWLILPTMYVQVSDARSVRSQIQRRKRYVDTFGDEAVKQNEANERLRNDNITYCFDTEPCQFGLYKKSHGRMYSFVLIPSWCSCMPTQRCAVDRYDHKKKAEIYTCQTIPMS